MTNTAPVHPELIRWAIDRSGLASEDLATAFPKLDEWKRGKRLPTFRQLEAFAKKTMTPLGYLYLDAPPEERLPIPDFRTVGDARIDRPSPNLIETIQAMQRRQAWMREYLIEQAEKPLGFVGAAKHSRNVVSLAARIRDTLGLIVDWAELHSTWEDALRTLRQSAEHIGILVATSSVVGLNNHRPLDPQEFRGFVVCDSYAPLIFVNGADSKSAQMFTLAHELAHVWLGQDGLFNLIKTMPHDDDTERYCNQVAAEFLVPRRKLLERWQEAQATGKPFQTIARWCKVSPVVAARRALDLRLISKAQFFVFYEQDQEDWRHRKAEEKVRKKGGPNFYDVQDVRLGRRFAYAVVRAAREGRLLFREAYQLTDLKGQTFNQYADRLIQRMKDERR
ncbi:MAG: ImmA/IrrE family metallo-endopeptidase [Thermoguttaceae bacterium]|jgi:Zn-dependent peptidase ImmA (M78 family)|nr:ImmA/IrrE family metallo-endopeptidase [Thermoguttaceae bacterium]